MTSWMAGGVGEAGTCCAHTDFTAHPTIPAECDTGTHAVHVVWTRLCVYVTDLTGGSNQAGGSQLGR